MREHDHAQRLFDPHCNVGKLGSLKEFAGRSGLNWQCSHYNCSKYVTPAHGHLVYNKAWGASHTDLNTQAAILMCNLAGVSQQSAHILLGVNHKLIGGIYKRAAQVRRLYVEDKEKEIEFGNGKNWQDVEADDAVFLKKFEVVKDVTKKKKATQGKKWKGKGKRKWKRQATWEQWAGIIQRGKPSSLVLKRTKTSATKASAPGPGAIKKFDWKPLGTKHLLDRKVILHTDRARSYRLRLRGVLHDSVRHSKKLVLRHGKRVLLKPKFVVTVKHTLPGGRKIKVKAGTQVIDRAWRFLKDRITNRSALPGSDAIRN